tara:strand:- start:5447 stop:5731 length:285 start_codon:yes stop_codon:yes gene_type:complete
LHAGLNFTERDFFKDKYSSAELTNLLGNLPPSEIFNFKSVAFKKSGLDPQVLTEDRLFELLLDEPRYWRRPLLVVDGVITPGASVKQISEMLNI